MFILVHSCFIIVTRGRLHVMKFTVKLFKFSSSTLSTYYTVYYYYLLLFLGVPCYSTLLVYYCISSSWSLPPLPGTECVSIYSNLHLHVHTLLLLLLFHSPPTVHWNILCTTLLLVPIVMLYTLLYILVTCLL